MKKYLPKSEFSGHVLTLMTGTIVAQAIPIAISPILTRLYTPEEFGLLALFIAITSILGVVATARYELAIVQPNLERDVDNLTILSLIITGIVSVVTLILILVLNQHICDFLNNQEISNWLYWVPISVFGVGCFQSLNYWHNRRKSYRYIATAKVSQSIGSSSFNLALSGIRAPAFGLIAGHIFGQVLGVALIAKKAFSNTLLIKNFNFRRCIVLSKRYKNFPKYSSLGALLDSASLQMPVLLLSRYFDSSIVGYFNFSFRIIGAPMNLISSSISQVLLQKIATAKAEEVYSIVTNISRKLYFSAVPFIIIIFVFGEDIFAMVFGENWRQAGEFSKILIFSVAVRFVVSPLSVVLALNKNVRVGVFWQVIYFISVLTVLLLAKDLPINQFLIVFVIQDIVLYLVYYYLIMSAAKRMKLCVE